jgi:hypothetical protein
VLALRREGGEPYGPITADTSKLTKTALATADRRSALKRQRHNRRSLEMPRELIDTGTDKRFVRRDQQGQFKESDDVGRSLAADRRQKATTKAKKGEGDRGDRK